MIGLRARLILILPLILLSQAEASTPDSRSIETVDRELGAAAHVMGDVDPDLPTPVPALARILFAPSEAVLLPQARADLDSFASDFSHRMGRLEIRAYGGDTENGQSTNPRRIALKRALAVRAQLLDRGIAGERLVVRAFPAAQDNGPRDRVDIMFATR